ncbi:MAG: YigZ family protein [Maribacter sp.]
MENIDAYKTISKPSNEILFKEKKSKFFGYAFPINTEDEVRSIIESLRKKHHTANHFCYAWQLGETDPRYRVNDDGEPKNSAGAPIHGQIQSFKVTNVLVVVIRIFGGTKLGIGGLIRAYRTAAQLALKQSTIIKRTIKDEIKIKFEYSEIDKVMGIIRQNQLKIISQDLEIDCIIVISSPKNKSEQVIDFFAPLNNVTILKNEFPKH